MKLSSIAIMAILPFSGAQELNVTSTCVCTTVPCPVSDSPYYSNYLTEGGGGTGKYNYVTHNGKAVVSSASFTLTKSNLDKGSDTTSCTQEYSRSLDDDGTADCDAGHILANRLGGPGNQPINIFPQDLSINRGAYAQFENDIYDCMAYQGASQAALNWDFTYSSTTRTKPSKVRYSVDFTGGTCADMIMDFNN